MADETTESTATPNKVLTWLQKAGAWLGNALHIGVEVAEVAEPFVDIGVPEVGALYNSTVGLFVAAEAAYGSAPGQGQQKLAYSVPVVTANLKTWAAANGFEVIEGDVEKWITPFVNSLNALPIKLKS